VTRRLDVALGLAALLVAGFAAVTAWMIGSVAFDETVHQASAARLAYGDLLSAIFSDPTARATSRLYPLVLWPLWELLDGVAAVRAGRVLGVVLLVSTAVPVALLARELGLRGRAAAAAGVLSVAAPWLSLGTALFTEVAAYPASAWALWAVVRALRAPAPGRDLLALALLAVALTTRFQLATFLLAYWALALLWHRRRLRAFPASAAALALVAVAVLVVLATGGYDDLNGAVTGTYREVAERERVSTDVVLGLLSQLYALALGVGVLPALLALVMLAVSRTREAAAAVAPVALLALVTVWAQGGFRGDRLEERYFLYAVPLLWIGALLAVRSPRIGRGAVAAAAGGAVLVAATVPVAVPLTDETVFLAPASAAVQWLAASTVGEIEGVGIRDAVLLPVAALAAAFVWAWPRSRARPVVAIGVPVVLQLALTVWVLAISWGAGPLTARTGGDFAARGWVDAALRGDEQARWLNAQPREAAGAAETRERLTFFWNERLRRRATVPGLPLPPVAFPYSTLPGARLESGRGPLVQPTDGPFLQLHGRVRARSPLRDFELIDLLAYEPVRWRAEGLSQESAVVGPIGFVADDATGGGTTVRLALEGAAGGPTAAAVRFATESRRVELAPGQRLVLELTTCREGPRRGTITPLTTAPGPGGALAVGRLQRVRVTPAAPGACS
jgi:hypothetical protein